MRFIGQHIWKFISRFYSSVYFNSVEEYDSDADKFLAIDANNKLVYRTGANLLDDIGGGTGNGTITGVSITTDSGSGSRASDNTGTADFSILGSSGVNVTNSGVTITATAVPSEIDHDSLNNFVAAEHVDWAGGSAGTIHSSNLPTLYSHSAITFLGQATMLSSGNWVMVNKPGISSHTWNKDIAVNTETNGSTTATVPKQWGHAGIRMPFACIIDGISCAINNASGNRQVTIGLFFARASDGVTAVDWGTTDDTQPVLQIHADTNNEGGTYTNRPTHAEITGSNISMAAGDVFYPAIKLTGVTSGGNTDNVYASITVHVKTAIS